MYREAKKALNFVLNGQLENGAFPQRYDTKGNDASYKPIQIDGTGLIIYSFVEYVKATNDKEFLDAYWPNIQKAVGYIKQNLTEGRNLVYTPNSVHEFPPMEDGLEIWANCVCCAAVRNLCRLSKKYKRNNREWIELANKIQGGIEKYLWNSRVKSFVKLIRLKEASSVDIDIDASQLALSVFKIIPDDDKRMKSTIKRMEKELIHKELGGLCRYHKYEGRNNGGWGPWPHFTLMLCRHFIMLRDKKKADKYLNWVLKISYKDLLPEHISTIKEFEEYVTDFEEAGLLRKDRLVMIENARKHPMFKKGLAYITIPLAWPHAEFIITWNAYKKYFF
jgi:GH15 family glucan-1,4-alpha-glucosidase